MPIVRVAGFGISLHGFSAGIEQSLDDPLGKRGTEIFQWLFHIKAFCEMHGREGGIVDGDDVFAWQWLENFGAFILGRNTFGPVRGPWKDDLWEGWRGPNPPYHAPTFVLTRYQREPLVMEGGTTFYFVSGGIAEALRLAKQAAGDKDVTIGGGVSTVRQYLQAGLIDSIHFAVAPVALGEGEALLPGLDLHAMGFTVTEHVATECAMHVVLTRGQQVHPARPFDSALPDLRMNRAVARFRDWRSQEQRATGREARKGSAKNYRLERFFRLDIADSGWQSKHTDHFPDVMMGTNSEVPS